MIFGPVLPVELVTTSRRARYYIIRVLYAAALLVTLWSHYSMASFRLQFRASPTALAEFAREFFQSFSVVQILAVLLLTPSVVAGTIAEEKERRTLEFLLATDLRNHEIVLGKLAGRMLNLIVLIAVGVPILAITMLLGGVGLESIAVVFAITLVTLMAASVISIWSSVYARKSRDAMQRAAVLGTILLAVPPLFRMLPWLGRGLPYYLEVVVEAIVDQLMVANPFSCLGDVLTPSGVDWFVFLAFARNMSVLSLVLGAVAVWRLRAVFLKQTYGTTARVRSTRFQLWRPEIGRSPMIWKELFAERWAGSRGVWALFLQGLLALAVLVPTVWIFLQVDSTRRGFANWDHESFRVYVSVMSTALACLGILVIAVRTATSVTSERERQSLDMLLSTPLTPIEIVQGKLAGAFYSARGLMLLTVILWGFGVAARSVMLVAIPLSLIAWLAAALFAGLVGLGYSLKLKSSNGASTATLATTVFVGGGYLFCCLPIADFGSRSGTEIILAGCVPWLIALPVAGLDPDGTQRGLVHQDTGFVVAAVIGAIGYFGMASLLLGVITNAFDDMVGRVGSRLASLTRPRYVPRDATVPTALLPTAHEAAVEPPVESFGADPDDIRAN